MSPTTKLLHHADSGVTKFVATVEAFPIKLLYRVVENENDLATESKERTGFLLVSHAARIVDVVPAVRRAVAPNKSSSCVRIWSKMDCSRPDGSGATAKGDGYELVHVDRLDGALVDDEEEVEPSSMTVGEWVSRHCSSTSGKAESLDLLVETRARPNSKWAREDLELGNRLEVRMWNKNDESRLFLV